MATGRILDLAAKSQEIYENEMPAALIYFKERVPVHDWQELFFIAVKCLYAEFPDTINSLCSTDPTRTLFLRTNTIDMVSPKKIAPIIYLETNRTPQQILKAIRLIFNRANVKNIQMRVEVREVLYLGIRNKEQGTSLKTLLPAKKPVLHLNQTIEEMLATLDAMEIPKNSKVIVPHAEPHGKIEPQVFGNLFFILEGTRHGPFANEKNRYVALMQCLAELYPYQILKEAGHHINSMHRLTLMKCASYLYFREPVELPNNLFIDKDFPDRVLIENERYYLARCGLYFESVIFNA
ncbi:MAG: hypothetical protein IJL14_02930 [Selenomonadaceae bacterium]|nr:hypothetical protein [Selenomonadaceae bacterium]